jgi:hypothetical protein
MSEESLLSGKKANGTKAQINLSNAVRLAGWPTPNVSVIEAKSKPPIMHNRKPTDPQIGLADVAVHVAGWPTPRVRDVKGGYEGGRIRDGKVSVDSLDVAGQLAGWPTARANDSKGAKIPPNRQGGVALKTAVLLLDNPEYVGETIGENQFGGLVGMEKFEESQQWLGQMEKPKLNPRFSLWLMGFPKGWACSGVRAMQSCRRSPRRS